MQHVITLNYHGVTRTVREWAEFLGMSYYTLLARLRRGWSEEEAIETPVGHSDGGRRTHGWTGTKEYKAWKGMAFRCENPKNNRWHRYGARGIAVCGTWRDDFQAFLTDVGPAPSPKHSLGRLDHDRNYEPGNVAWQTTEEQVAAWKKSRRREKTG